MPPYPTIRPMTRLAIFDCDGTLVDSQHNICAAVEQSFASNGLAAPPRNTIRRIVGLSLVEAMRMLLPDADDALHQRISQDYKDAFFHLRSTGAMAEEPLYDGIADLLAALSAQGWRLGVATGKSDRGLAHVLSHHGIAGHFITLQTADRHPSKPHPAMIEAAMREAGAAPDATAMIGDTSFDMEMARAGGVHAIGVSWGYHAATDLADAGAHHIVDDVAALATLLEQL